MPRTLSTRMGVVLLVWDHADRGRDAVGHVEHADDLDRFEDLVVVEPGGAQRLQVGGSDLVRVAGELLCACDQRPPGTPNRSLITIESSIPI